MPRLEHLGDELLAHVLSFSAARDVEALTVASSVVAREVVARFPSIWRTLFCRRWEMLNFPLDGVATGDAALEINEHLNELFPSSCTEGRKFQLLAHAVIPVPSYADIKETQKALGFTDAYHRIISLQVPELNESHSVDFALDGGMLGDDRCVRANVPFPTTFHVAVYRRSREEGAGRTRPVFEVDVVPGGYFELSLSKRQHRHVRVPIIAGQDSMTAIGVVNARFPLVGKQPGWTRRSYGYHGDDGRFYHQTPFEGQSFGPMFKAGGTVGCGVRVNPTTNTPHVFFTHNGQLITGANGAYIECEQRDWYPAVGLDSYDALHLNFGQEPFKYSGLVDSMFQGYSGQASVISQHLQWYDIRDSDGETSSDDETSEDEDLHDYGSDVSDEEISARLIMRILAMRRAGIAMDMDVA